MSFKKDTFEGFVQRHFEDPGWALDYLKAGLPADLNLNGNLTPEVFKKHFLVERPANNDLDALIKELFQDENHNLLCIESDRGSGKSTFVQTLHMNYDSEHSYEYPFPIIDFSAKNAPKTRLENNQLIVEDDDKYNESDIFKKFRKRYAKACKITEWIRNYYKMLQGIVDYFPNYQESDGYIETLIKAKDCKNIKEYDGFWKGHSERLKELNNKDVDAKVLLLLYLLTFMSEPSVPDRRWIIIFDSIEVYVGNDATNVANTIRYIWLFLRAACDSIGKRKDFLTRFTAIFPIRTATSLCFSLYAIQQQGVNLWGAANRYIFQLPRYDFASVALLKKLGYLYAHGGKNSSLFKRCMLLASLVMPRKYIEDWLVTRKGNEGLEFRLFTKNKLMPLFNYDFRTIIDRLYDILPSTGIDYVFNALASIQENAKKIGVSFDCAANGENMITSRLLFDVFHNQIPNLFAQIGYTDFNSGHEPGIARNAFNFLYYCELKYYYDYRGQEDLKEFPGVPFGSLLEKLRPFAKNEMQRLSKILFNASILTGEDPDDYYIKNLWTNLIVIKNMSIKLSADGFLDIIRRYYDGTFTDSDKSSLLDCKVKLSDAGRSFTVWVSKQFEFLLSRSELPTKPVFSYCCASDIRSCLDPLCTEARKIILEEGIKKLIDKCMEGCSLCGNYKEYPDECNCAFCKESDKTMFDCSLFHRYQECLMLIVDCIDYIDRFRVYVFQSGRINGKTGLIDVNNWLLDQIASFNKLFDELNTQVNKYLKTEERTSKFYEKMQEVAMECNRALKITDENRDCFDKKKQLYYERLRLPRTHRWYHENYFLFDEEIKKLKDNPGQRLYDVLSQKTRKGY